MGVLLEKRKDKNTGADTLDLLAREFVGGNIIFDRDISALPSANVQYNVFVETAPRVSSYVVI